MASDNLIDAGPLLTLGMAMWASGAPGARTMRAGCARRQIEKLAAVSREDRRGYRCRGQT